MKNIVITKIVKEMIDYYDSDEINESEIIDDLGFSSIGIPDEDDVCNYALSTRFLFEYLMSQKGFMQNEIIKLY